MGNPRKGTETATFFYNRRKWGMSEYQNPRKGTEIVETIY